MAEIKNIDWIYQVIRLKADQTLQKEKNGKLEDTALEIIQNEPEREKKVKKKKKRAVSYVANLSNLIYVQLKSTSERVEKHI